MSNEVATSGLLTNVREAEPAPQGVRLDYENRGDPSIATPVHARRGWRAVWLIALLPGLVVPFLPFACNASPAEIVWEGGTELLQKPAMGSGDFAMWQLSIPFFLAFPLVLWKLLRLLRVRSSRWGRRAGLAIGTLGAVLFMGSIAQAARGAANPYEWALVIGAAAGIALVVSLAIALLVRPGVRDEAVEASMLGPYVMTLAFAMACWWKDAKIGWYLAISPAVGGLLELLMVGWFAWRTRGRRRLASGPPGD